MFPDGISGVEMARRANTWFATRGFTARLGRDVARVVRRMGYVERSDELAAGVPYGYCSEGCCT